MAEFREAGNSSTKAMALNVSAWIRLVGCVSRSPDLSDQTLVVAQTPIVILR